MSKMSNPVTIKLNEREIYDLEWLEECYKKVRFPNPKCEEFLVEINKTLSHKIRGELDNKIKQQALFSLLGQDYVRIHFPHHKYDLSLLEPPKTKPDVKKAYVDEMKNLVQEQIQVTLKECGYPEDVSEYDGDNQLGEFLNEVRRVFKDELNLQMDMATTADRIRDIEADALSAAGDDRLLEEQQHELQEFQPSAVPGEAFVAAAKHSQQSARTALKIFKEKALMFPLPMRKYLWEDFIYTHKALNGKKKASIQTQRQEFCEYVNKKIPKGQMNRAVQSPDVKIIYSVIIDSYQTTKVLLNLAEDDFMITAAYVINVLNVIEKKYSNAQVFWLVPLQLVYPQEDYENQENYIIRLSNHLQLISKYCALPWKDVHSVASDILNAIKEHDPQYLNHLKMALEEKTSPVDVYDFAYEILHKDAKKSQKVWQELYKKKKKDWKERDLAPFADVAIYLRKWISEAFAGIYGGQTIMFVWDYCFMHGWTRKVFYKIGLVSLMLIKPFALEADNHRKMGKVLFNEPSNLYLKDLRKALLHYEEHVRNDLSAIQSITELNTNFEYKVQEPVEEEEPDEENDDKNDNDNVEESKDSEERSLTEEPENVEDTETPTDEGDIEKSEDNAENPENPEKE